MKKAIAILLLCAVASFPSEKKFKAIGVYQMVLGGIMTATSTGFLVHAISTNKMDKPDMVLYPVFGITLGISTVSLGKYLYKEDQEQ